MRAYTQLLVPISERADTSYMDDILMLYAEHERWDSASFLRDFEESHCYWKPLRLEHGDDGVFLETAFTLLNNRVVHRLKNANELEQRVWRYHDNGSYCSSKQKRAVFLACLRKVDKMASDNNQLWISAIAKLREFKSKGYSAPLMRYLCSIMGRDTRNVTWFKIRSANGTEPLLGEKPVVLSVMTTTCSVFWEN